MLNKGTSLSLPLTFTLSPSTVHFLLTALLLLTVTVSVAVPLYYRVLSGNLVGHVPGW